MNNLTLNISKCNTEQKTSYVTTKELSEVLGVDISTVKKSVKRMEEGGEILHHLTKDKYNNTCFVFNEEQATIIKQEIQKHHNLASRQIDTVSTEFEENQIIRNAMAILELRDQRLQARIKELQNENMELAPKAEVYERISDSTGLKTIGETAKILGIGEKRLFAYLRSNGVFFYDNGINQVKQTYINSGYFQTKENPYVQNGITKLYTRIFVTSKGLIWLEKQIK